MIQLRHVGIYAKNLDKLTEFYKTVFKMHVLCENIVQEDELIYDLLEKKSIQITKLITDYGKRSGSGDMLELLHYECAAKDELPFISDNGVVHICFSVADIVSTMGQIITFGGSACTKIYTMNNGNKCCFCRDPEGNWLELIEPSRQG